MTDADSATTRVDRRKLRTRTALIDAAKELIVAGRSQTASIQQITDLADIGFGSFYNHFSSKDDLFKAATGAALEEWGDLIDHATEGIVDPAERFAASFRISARLAWSHPELARVINQFGLDLLVMDDGLAPRALRDLETAVAAGRFSPTNLPVALAVIAGSLLGFVRIRINEPEIVDQSAVEDLTFQLLRMLGVTESEAHMIAKAPLPATGI
jgi:AcrR family transcriptional regulator